MGCVLPIVVVRMLSDAELGQNGYRKGAPHFRESDINFFDFQPYKLKPLLGIGMIPIDLPSSIKVETRRTLPTAISGSRKSLRISPATLSASFMNLGMAISSAL